MKTTLEIPDELFRATKARAAVRGESLKQYVCDSLRARLEREGPPADKPGWRRVFGRARPDEVREIDKILEDVERIDPQDWR